MYGKYVKHITFMCLFCNHWSVGEQKEGLGDFLYSLSVDYICSKGQACLNRQIHSLCVDPLTKAHFLIATSG